MRNQSPNGRNSIYLIYSFHGMSKCRFLVMSVSTLTHYRRKQYHIYTFEKIYHLSHLITINREGGLSSNVHLYIVFSVSFHIWDGEPIIDSYT
jgi:hypothetical protein